MIPRKERLLYGCRTARIETREEQRRLHLRGRNRRTVAYPMQCASLDQKRRAAIAPHRPDLRAHLGERLRDAAHRTSLYAFIPRQPDREVLCRKDTGEKPHRRSGIPAVQRYLRTAKPAQPSAADPKLRLIRRQPDLRAHRPEALYRRQAVRAMQEARRMRLPLRDRPQHHRAVRYALIAGNRQLPPKPSASSENRSVHQSI